MVWKENEFCRDTVERVQNSSLPPGELYSPVNPSFCLHVRLCIPTWGTELRFLNRYWNLSASRLCSGCGEDWLTPRLLRFKRRWRLWFYSWIQSFILSFTGYTVAMLPAPSPPHAPSPFPPSGGALAPKWVLRMPVRLSQVTNSYGNCSQGPWSCDSFRRTN